MQGLIHVYYGDGKGKTSAALGLALRAAGSGKSVVFAQFLKYRASGELKSLALVPNVIVICSSGGDSFGGGKFWFQMNENEKAEAKSRHDAILQRVISLHNSGFCDVLILDEVMDAYELGAVDKELLEGLVDNKPEGLELVITGHSPVAFFTDRADYLTQMRKHKHPYDKGISARDGIEV